MKWFVTDAQLDAMMDATVSACAATVAALSARHEAEVARLRDDRREEQARLVERHELEVARLRNDRGAELDRLADPHAPFLAHLTELVAILRRDVVHERQRAEVAIDQCRAMHQSIGPVTLPPRPETAEGPRGANPFSDPELAAMGDPIGL
jgi:hypothetical protein